MRAFQAGLLATLLLPLLVTIAPSQPAAGARRAATYPALLPLVAGPPTGLAPVGGLRVNAPYYPAPDLDSKFGELAIFWFGKVTPSQNYADVRVGYNDAELYIYVAIFDRRLWFDSSPTAADLRSWDAITLYLDTVASTTLAPSSHMLVAQLSGSGGTAYQAAYSAASGAWLPASTPFVTSPGWRGERLNDDGDDRGWAMTFRVPFASLGRPGRPADGATWRMALALHDRDDAAGTPVADQTWPPAASATAPASWGTLTFGTPGYAPPAVAALQSFTIRQGLGGAVVPDAAVGGGSTCGDGLELWGEWGTSTRDARKGDFNVQNQSDIADWPCFSKYFVTFPLSALPAGQVVVSATLVLHQFGNAEPSQAQPSLLQALTVSSPWEEATVSWNSAPLAAENVGSAWVAPLAGFVGWPGVRRELDVTRAVAQAYSSGRPLQLALYSADEGYHSGKYFVSSDTGDWNAVGRPTLLITLGRLGR